MRIAYLINSLDGYGAGLPVPMVARFMRESGAEVRLFALARRDGRLEPVLEEAGLPFAAAPDPATLRSMVWLRNQLSAYRPTLIWTSLVRATLAGRAMGLMLRTPVVSWQHNIFLKAANVAALAATRRLTHLWVADSHSVAAMTKKRFGLTDVAVWPLFKADPGAAHATPARAGERFRLGSLGRLHPHKGYDVLIRAMAKIQRDCPRLAERFSVTIGGDGPDRARLEHMARAHNVQNLSLAGYQADASGFLATLHGYIQPSRTEGLCIAAHQAMQAGLPAIVSAIGEMPLTVRHGQSGIVVSPRDVRDLSAAIQGLVENPARAAAMGAAARASVNDRFSSARFRAAGQEVMRTAAALAR